MTTGRRPGKIFRLTSFVSRCIWDKKLSHLPNSFGYGYRELVNRYRFINHDCHAPDLIPVGQLRTGRTVKINRRVHEAHFRIGIGSVFPHPMNGFAGGGKILFPGVADFDSILDHHFQYTFHEGTGLGKIEGNLFYEQVSAVARSARLDFIFAGHGSDTTSLPRSARLTCAETSTERGAYPDRLAPGSKRWCSWCSQSHAPMDFVRQGSSSMP